MKKTSVINFNLRKFEENNQVLLVRSIFSTKKKH